MDVGTLFLYFCGAFVASLLLVALNILGMMRSIGNDRMPAFSFGLHVIGGLVANLSALGALVTGIVWLVQHLKT